MGQKQEMVAPILIDLEELDEMTTIAPDFSNPQNVQTKAPFGVVDLIGHKIHHADTFMKNGKNIISYTVVLTMRIMLIKLLYSLLDSTLLKERRFRISKS